MGLWRSPQFDGTQSSTLANSTLPRHIILSIYSTRRNHALTDSINPQINYWIARAEETLKEAKILAEAGYWNACVNRLYYSCFYAITALLVRDGLSTSKHSGVRGFFNRNYVKTGMVPKDLAYIIFCSIFVKKRIMWNSSVLMKIRYFLGYHGLRNLFNT